jgi:hypothetical protein
MQNLHCFATVSGVRGHVHYTEEGEREMALVKVFWNLMVDDSVGLGSQA